jgi:hypothetical protein
MQLTSGQMRNYNFFVVRTLSNPGKIRKIVFWFAAPEAFAIQSNDLAN